LLPLSSIGRLSRNHPGKVLDIPPQQCITRDNVSITVDAVVYWRIVDMEKAYYKVENLKSAMVNLLTQIR